MITYLKDEYGNEYHLDELVEKLMKQGMTKEKAIENYHEIKEFVQGTCAEGVPIIPISAQQGANIDILIEKYRNFFTRFEKEKEAFRENYKIEI